MDYQKKIDLIREKLGKTQSERLADNFAKQAEFEKKRKLEKDEQEKAHKQAEIERQALLLAEQEAKKLAEERAKAERERLIKIRQEQALADRAALQDRKEKALAWVSEEREKYRKRCSENTRVNHGLPLTSYDLKRIKQQGLINPAPHWFDGQFYIKKQFEDYYDV